MGVLQRFEQRLDRLVNGAFARAFRSEVQPVEIAGALQRELDDKAAIVSRDRTVAPNTFTVELGSHDHARLSPYDEPLAAELAEMVGEHAQSQHYALLGPIEVRLQLADDLNTGVFRVVSGTTPEVTARPEPRSSGTPSSRTPPPVVPAPIRPAPAPLPIDPAPLVSGPLVSGPHDADGVEPEAPSSQHPRLVVHGTAYPLTRRVTTVGRSADVDIRVDDPGVSRKHAAFHLGDPCTVADLGSTNGTLVRGSTITEAALSDGDEIRLGSTTLVFRTG